MRFLPWSRQGRPAFSSPAPTSTKDFASGVALRVRRRYSLSPIYLTLPTPRPLDLDLEAQPVTDMHCFSFAPNPKLTRRSLSKLFLSGGPTVMGSKSEVRQEDLLSSVAYRRMVRELSLLLQAPDSDLDVLRKRNERARDFAGYVKALCEDAKIERAVLDNGIEPVGFEEFRRYTPARLYRVFRIEPILKRLLDTSESFSALFDSFDEVIGTAVRKRGFVGFKSIVAYRTGLDVGEPDEGEARRSFEAYRKGEEQREWFGPRVKPLRDLFLCHVAERSKKLGSFLENHWMSAKLAKRALGGSLGDLVAEGVLDLDEAHQTGDLILNSNATKLLA